MPHIHSGLLWFLLYEHFQVTNAFMKVYDLPGYAGNIKQRLPSIMILISCFSWCFLLPVVTSPHLCFEVQGFYSWGNKDAFFTSIENLSYDFSVCYQGRKPQNPISSGYNGILCPSESQSVYLSLSLFFFFPALPVSILKIIVPSMGCRSISTSIRLRGKQIVLEEFLKKKKKKK